MMQKSFLISIIYIFLTTSLVAQSFLVLEKMGTKKRYEFHLGDQLEVMLDDDDFFTRINILGLKDSSIITDYEEVFLSRIVAIHLTGQGKHVKAWGPPLMLAGIILFAIDIINQTTGENKGDYSPSPAITTASISLFGLGAILTFSGRNKIKLKKWWRLRVVQV